MVLQNVTGEWHTTIKDLNKLMADQIPSKDPVDINFRLDPYQTAMMSTSIEQLGMSGAGYGPLGVINNQPMHT